MVSVIVLNAWRDFMTPEDHIKHALYELGITTQTYPETRRTPDRIAKMWRDEFFTNTGVEYSDFALSSNERNYSQIIHFPRIHFVSCCAHHLLPFSGDAHLLYIPIRHLVGASKPSRLIEHYSKRPQLQETLTHDIIDCFERNVHPLGTMIVISGHHDCMSCRGVKQKDAGMVTSAVEGVFATEEGMETKGYELIKLSMNH